MKTVYFISGMGADERAFQYLDLSFCQPVFVRWIKPLQNEMLAGYAARLAAQITEREPVIVGFSFGGIIGIEMAKLFPVKKLVLLSSAKTTREIPFYYRILRFLPLHEIFSVAFIKSANQFVYHILGIAKRKDKIAINQMLRETDNHLFKWSMGHIITWNNNQFPQHTHHIHGTKDITLPYRFIKANETVQGGEHSMLMSKPEAVSELLKKAIHSSEP